MSLDRLPTFIREHYELHEWNHGQAILELDFPNEWNDLVEVLTGFRLYRSAIATPGGRKSSVADALDREFFARGWEERKFNTKVVVDESERETPTHKVDCYKNNIGIEIEWNNKDPFYDRDLNNFRLLFELKTISVGVIVTRCDDLQDIFNELGRGPSYGNSTTHMSKLLPRIYGGGGGGCPLLVFGITKKLYVEDEAAG